MTRILVAYGTTDGQTGKIAQFIVDELRQSGALADLVEPSRDDNPNPREYDGVIVAASVHIGKYQRNIVRWVRDHSAELQGMPSLFLSVSLAVLQTDGEARRELAEIVSRFLNKTGWEPEELHHVAGALRYTRYIWITKLIMRRIAAKQGGATDTSRDHEYTDWEGIRALTHHFLEVCAAPQHAHSA